jgi:hypothetical protein
MADAFFRQIGQALNPDTNGVSKALDPNQNGFTNALTNAFDPDRNNVKNSFTNFANFNKSLADTIGKATQQALQQTPAVLKKALDPNENGVKDAFTSRELKDFGYGLQDGLSQGLGLMTGITPTTSQQPTDTLPQTTTTNSSSTLLLLLGAGGLITAYLLLK